MGTMVKYDPATGVVLSIARSESPSSHDGDEPGLLVSPDLSPVEGRPVAKWRVVDERLSIVDTVDEDLKNEPLGEETLNFLAESESAQSLPVSLTPLVRRFRGGSLESSIPH